MARLLRFVDLALENGDRFERGIQLAVQAVLGLAPVPVPGRARLARRGGGSRRNETGGVPIGDFEVASRLSYFLWSTMPDDELFRLATEGKLRPSDNLDSARSGGCSGTPSRKRSSRTSPGSGCSSAT